MTPSERQLLTQLQRGVKITSRPFWPSQMLDVLKKAEAQGVLRRFGGVFDARRLGYQSMLCALDVPASELAEKAALVGAHPGVTHCYERRPLLGAAAYPTLWFTLAMPHTQFERGLRALSNALAVPVMQFPALRRFKIDVVFNLTTRPRDEIFPDNGICSDLSFYQFSEEERALVRALDQQLPLVEQPFAAVADQLGQSEVWVLATLREWQRLGILRRVGAVLYHRAAGFKANAMCVWPLSEEQIVAAGRRVAARPEVTHCYQRPRRAGFPFDLYAMIHTGTWDATRALFADISAQCGLSNGELFASEREFKKSSMRYFREG